MEKCSINERIEDRAAGAICPCLVVALAAFTFVSQIASAQAPSSVSIITSSKYTAVLKRDAVPRIVLASGGRSFFRFPVVSGLLSVSGEESLSAIELAPLTTDRSGAKILIVTAKSSLWQSRRFVWKFFSDHVEFQQFAEGNLPIVRCYFFSSGVSGYFDNGSSRGISFNTVIDADRYFSPNPNFANQLTHSIEVPQSLGVTADPGTESLGRGGNSRLFSPPPLALSFGHGEVWSSVGIGTLPGRYQFNGLEFSGERYAGASFWVDYQGRLRTPEFASPVAAIHFGHSDFGVLAAYIGWVDARGFSTHRSIANAQWHRLPIFCGWAEQTAIAGSETAAASGTSAVRAHQLPTHVRANQLATQENYTKWVAELEKRGIPVSTIIIDDKWCKSYGGLDIDEQKWPDMKRFVDEQHAHGRHVLLWIPMASAEGLRKEWTVTQNGRAISADVSNPEYESFLPSQIRHLIVDIGIDGFKEDWIGPPRDFSHVVQHSDLYGMEFVHRFQFILFDEAHKCKRDAMVETQTPNPLFRDSSDVLRLNDIYSATRNVAEVMRARAAIARAAGWKLIDTDNASTTTLTEWWRYMQAQPSIGIPALYFVSETAVTHEQPSASQWLQLAAIWRSYAKSVLSAPAE